MTDLQRREFGGSTKKTPWQVCQRVVGERPEQVKRKYRSVNLCTVPVHIGPFSSGDQK